MKKLTKRQIKKLIAEEKKDSKMYRGYGLNKIAKEETDHAKRLSKLLKHCK